MTPLSIPFLTASSCVGRGLAATLAALSEGRSGLKPCDFETVSLETFIGEVTGLGEVDFPASLAAFDCRNNRLAHLGLMQDDFAAHARECVARWGPERVGVFIGTSTAGILETEIAFRHRDPLSGGLPPGFDYPHRHNSFSVSDFVRRTLGISGPATSVCTACSSSAKVFASAERMIRSGLIDAAVVGGVDSLCLTTLYGFNALQLISRTACRPFDRHRDGLSIGEAAAFAIVERSEAAAGSGGILLLGCGESSDAHHMSSPHPDGIGARSAMQRALDAAGLAASQVDYINLHGTGTPSNDSAEAAAVRALFGSGTPCSSTKAATGHTLGAAGALEAVICALALQNGLVPPGLNRTTPDPQLQVGYRTEPRPAPLRTALSNSFGFGGVNCSLVFGRRA